MPLQEFAPATTRIPYEISINKSQKEFSMLQEQIVRLRSPRRSCNGYGRFIYEIFLLRPRIHIYSSVPLLTFPSLFVISY